MSADCIKCWGCKCNGSCVCTPEEIMDYMRDNNIPLTTQQYVYEHRKDNPDERIKEIYEIDLSDYAGLSKSEAIQKFLIDTGKTYISINEIKMLWF